MLPVAITENKQGKPDKVDSLDDLPELVLQNVLSFLPTKDAIKTSILSKRWKNLWTYLSHVTIRNSDFNECLSGENRVKLMARTLEQFKSPKLKKVSLDLPEVEYPYHCIHQLLEFVTGYHVEELYLNSKDRDFPYYVPSEFFYTNSVLSKLSLKWCSLSPETLSWTSLKVLEIKHAEMYQDLFPMIFSGCPVLERFKLSDYCGNIIEPIITSDSLKELVLDPPGNDIGEFKIQAPKLLSLSLLGCSSWKYRLMDGSSLLAADLSFWISNERYVNYGNLTDMIMEYLNMLDHVQKLTLCSCCVDLLTMLEMETSPFLRLKLHCKYLTLNTWFPEYILAGLEVLLRSSPHMETLTINSDGCCQCDRLHELVVASTVGHHFTGERYWTEKKKNSCKTPNLKRVKIIGFDTTYKLVRELMEFLLGNAMMLEEIVVVSPGVTLEVTKL